MANVYKATATVQVREDGGLDRGAEGFWSNLESCGGGTWGMGSDGR